ncbi:MAG: hypothetical protein H0W74_05405 [Sphingosinicella sp.]|nr:hypothetical protein [Sphingosinicella sp.]
MKKIFLIASAAAMAASMPALAKPEKGGGGDGPQAPSHGNKGQKAPGGHSGGGRVKVQRTTEFKPQRMEHKPTKSADRQVRQERKAFKADHKQMAPARQDRQEWRGRGDGRAQRVAYDHDRRDRDGWDRDDWNNDHAGIGCPPGLAKKHNGCLPPGQARKSFAVGDQLRSDWYRDYNVPLSYRSFYSDSPEYYYRYDDNGYIYRVNRQSNLVSGLIPLLGGGFGVGQMLPAGYGAYNVPIQYRDTYYDRSDAYYRYGDNAIYQVDPQSQMIESVVALLTGNSMGVGQVLPTGYDAYNLPLQYRDQYYDNDDYNYRYSDGNIYQVDPQTQVIEAIISALL